MRCFWHKTQQALAPTLRSTLKHVSFLLLFYLQLLRQPSSVSALVNQVGVTCAILYGEMNKLSLGLWVTHNRRILVPKEFIASCWFDNAVSGLV